MTGQLALFDIPVRDARLARTYEPDVQPARPRLRLVPTGPRLGDRRAPTRLDPYGDRGLEEGHAEVIVRGWGRPVADVPVSLAGAL